MDGQIQIPKATVSVDMQTPRVVVVTAVGHLSKGELKPLQEPIDAVIQRGLKPVAFWDISGCPSVDPAFRKQMTEWHRKVRPQVESQNVLIGSKILGMAVSVANMLTGGVLNVFTNRDNFKKAIAEAAARTRV